jgi:hypothetical protein
MLGGFSFEKNSLKNIQEREEEKELEDSIVHALEIDPD